MTIENGARLEAVRQLVKQSVAKTMQMAVTAVEAERSLVSMGLDSLMAMELQVVIEREAGVKLSTLELMKGSTITQLSQGLLKRLLEDASESIPKESETHAVATKQVMLNPIWDLRMADRGDVLTAINTLERLHELSREELDSLLMKLSPDRAGASGVVPPPI
jgi:acyl carrier protein